MRIPSLLSVLPSGPRATPGGPPAFSGAWGRAERSRSGERSGAVSDGAQNLLEVPPSFDAEMSYTKSLLDAAGHDRAKSTRGAVSSPTPSRARARARVVGGLRLLYHAMSGSRRRADSAPGYRSARQTHPPEWSRREGTLRRAVRPERETAVKAAFDPRRSPISCDSRRNFKDLDGHQVLVSRVIQASRKPFAQGCLVRLRGLGRRRRQQRALRAARDKPNADPAGDIELPRMNGLLGPATSSSATRRSRRAAYHP